MQGAGITGGEHRPTPSSRIFSRGGVNPSPTPGGGLAPREGVLQGLEHAVCIPILGAGVGSGAGTPGAQTYLQG